MTIATRPPRPDRLSLWPVEGERFGLDATFTGATGYRLAEDAERSLAAAGLTTSLVQELDGRWTVRLGPLTAAAAEAAVAEFIRGR